MTPLRLHFSRGCGLASAAIAWFSAGWPSHVDAELDGGLYGARADRIGGVQAGVHWRPVGYERWKRAMTLELDVTESQYAAWRAFLWAQEGKPYDSSAIWGFAAGRDWRAPDSWFCSELQAAALEAAKICPPLVTPNNKVTPTGLSLLFSGAGAVEVVPLPKNRVQ